eukprot:CAMPEP_0114487810 /NCGR_PEP_ID=MMETSP0109-20121206/974_1 /TAXON_ID=29199 /ORGANISM="Chlorarachnion reptans, Strain CCCM449" /LENGTH=57 /DNA_ID=CAMNT_0001664119 /DNA_START=353 /DNA_END=523 /DNA_ORIENTATION=+
MPINHGLSFWLGLKEKPRFEWRDGKAYAYHRWISEKADSGLNFELTYNPGHPRHMGW